MYKFAGAACIAAALTCGVAVAEELRPIQAKSISLGDVSGVAYYTVEENGFAVVDVLTRDLGRTRVGCVVAQKSAPGRFEERA